VCYSPGFETIFSPDHQDRRGSLDRIIYYKNKQHMHDVKLYNALLLRKRNELAAEKPNLDVITVLNSGLLPVSEKISAARNSIVETINSNLSGDPMYEKIMPELSVALDISPVSDDDAEIRAKRPLYGCHKDLLYLKKGKTVVEKFQSFGQRKAALLLILQHISKVIENFRKKGIILVLDDFEAGLDKNRIDLFKGLFLNSNSLNRHVILTGIYAPERKAALML
jgi:DNA replication and repair protein RecF